MFSLTKDILIAGPFMGEFGWELMEWQGYIRKLSRKYKKTIAISYSSSSYLYDFCSFYPHNLKLELSGFGYGNYNDNAVADLIRSCVENYNISKYAWLVPQKFNRFHKLLIGSQEFKRYYEPPKGKIFDIVFHFRDLERKDGSVKNFPHTDSDDLAKFVSEKGFRCCCIGLPDLSYCPKNIQDCRSDDLRTTISVISSASLVIGGSSAPMHLAALCAKPLVVWIGPPANAKRYFTYWNPFNVRVFLVSDKTFKPEVQSVIQKVQEAINELNLNPMLI